MTIILLKDLINQRLRKQRELEFYTEQKDKLEGKMHILRHEIALTETILRLIRKEQITEIKS